MLYDSSRMWVAYCSLILFYLGASTVSCKSDGNSLDKYLFNGEYNKDVRPFIDQSIAVKVNISLTLTTILDVDEVSQSFSASGWLTLSWKDERLAWNESDFGNITTIYKPQRKIWLPDITLFNYYSEVVDFDYNFLQVMIQSDGSILWMPGGVFKAPCTIEVEKFPYDTQKCDLNVGTWSHSLDDLELVNTSTEIEARILQKRKNSQWDYASSSVRLRTGSMGFVVSKAVIFTINVSRKPTYCLLNYVFPVIVLAVLSIFVFQLPTECGEKLSYAITVLLAFSVYLSFLGDILPKTSDSTSLFSMYVSALVLCSALIAVLTVFLLKLAEKKTKVNALGKYSIALAYKLHGIEQSPYLKGDSEDGSEKTQESRESREMEVTWRTVSKAVDFFLFYVFLVFIVFLTVGMLLSISS